MKRAAGIEAAFRRFSAASSKALGSSNAFAASIVMVLVWAATGPHFHWSDSHSLFINTATTIITFLMVFLIQATQNRDAAILHLKLDELLHAIREAREDLVGIQNKPEEDFE